MSKNFFEVNSEDIKHILSTAHPPELFEVDSILENADTRELTKYEIALLIAAMNSPIFEEIKKKVISKSRTIRHRIHGNKVIPMAPVEVTNRCSSNCNFCGWRSDNKDMNRMTISESLMMTQISYLLSKGIGHIELVGGDDIGFVKNTLPKLIPEVKKKQKNMKGGKLSFCTMALTEDQYKKLKAIGADTMIMWQETYDKNVFKQHITAGPKAWGIDDDFKVIKGGDGYKFRLESQDRAAEAGLGLSVGAILGLNPDYGFEILATIDHANHLIEKWEPSEPIIVGMPTWNKITTPRTDNRPEQTLPIENFFTYFSCLYFLALNKHKTWVFPNCRVSIDIQVEAVDASGVFTSTEVKLGPGGYVNSALKHLTHTQQDKVKTELIALFKDDVDNSDIQKYLDDMEQFQHHYHVHEDYIAAFDKVNLVCETEKKSSHII